MAFQQRMELDFVTSANQVLEKWVGDSKGNMMPGLFKMLAS